MNPKTPAQELKENGTVSAEETEGNPKMGPRRLTAFLNAARPMRFFFFPFIGSSIQTRVRRIWISLSVNKAVRGKKELQQTRLDEQRRNTRERAG